MPSPRLRERLNAVLAWGNDTKPEFKVDVIVKGPSRAASGKLISETGTTITIQPAANAQPVTFDKSKVIITRLDADGRKVVSCRVLG